MTTLLLGHHHLHPQVIGILFLLGSLLCLGTWPALLRLCSWRPQLLPLLQPPLPQATRTRNADSSSSSNHACSCCSCLVWRQQSNNRRVRNVSHVYLDYALTYVVVSVVPLFVALLYWPNSKSNNNDHPANANNVNNDDTAIVMSTPLIATAMVGGALLSLGNLSFQWATVIYQCPLTTILALQASLTVVLGTLLNYLLQPHMTPHPYWLLAGVLAFLLAIGTATLAQVVYATEQQGHHHHHYHHHEMGQQQQQQTSFSLSSVVVSLPPCTRQPTMAIARHKYSVIELQNSSSYHKGQESDALTLAVHEEDTSGESNGATTSETSSFRHHGPDQRNRTGLLIATLGGVCFGFFSPCFNLAVNDPFGWNGNNDKDSNNSTTNMATTTDASLLVFYANLWFSLAFGAASILGNVVLLQHELHNDNAAAQNNSLTTILWSYLTQDSWKDRRLALLAGLVCAVGNILQFHGGQLVGYATADLVQAYPLVSTLWDILVFGEFTHVTWCCSRLSVLLVSMYAAYLGGIVLLAVSSME